MAHERNCSYVWLSYSETSETFHYQGVASNSSNDAINHPSLAITQLEVFWQHTYVTHAHYLIVVSVTPKL